MDFTNVLLLVVLSWNGITCFNDIGTFDIASFNVQVFGESKMGKPGVKENLVKIILRYDLILIQEIRDSSGEAIKELLELVKEVNQNYEMIVSRRLGRTSSKEQYAFIYRKDWMEIVDQYVYSDPEDVFEREPFVIKVKSKRTNVKTFAIAAIHASPGEAVAEINALVDVYDDIKTNWNIDDVIIMGDFNAGCNYVDSDDWSNIRLATDKRFYWLIDNSKDTTTKGTDCPYDRIVVAGETMIGSIVPKSAGVFHFDEEYQLSSQFTERISDHFPAFMQICTSYEKQNVIEKESASVRDTSKHVSKSNVRSIRDRAIELNYDVQTEYTSSGKQKIISVSKEVTGKLNLRKVYANALANFNQVLNIVELDTVDRQLKYEDILFGLPRGRGKYQTLYNYYASKTCNYLFQITCGMSTELCECSVSVKNKC